MAKALNVPETEHTHGDLMLTVKAQELELPSTTNWMLEMGRIEQVSLMISSRQNLQISLKCNLVTALLLHVSLYISHLLLIYCHFQTI
jgi:hypothetical protein